MYSIDDAEKFDINTIWDLYRKHISASQVELIGMFEFGREKVNYAEGCYIYLHNGRKVLDLTGGIGVLNHGHNHPRIIAARKKFEEKKRMEVHKNYFSPYLAALSANVSELMPEDLNISYFPNSGAESVEGAVKMAYKYWDGKRKFILHSDISFHGKLLGAASLTGSPEINFQFPQIPNVEKYKFGDIESVKECISRLRKSDNQSDIYALIIEPLSASTMRQASPDFLTELREICSIEGIILIFDEVYTGWGKTGTLFNFMRVPNLVPDIVTFAKSFGGGKASISGYTARESIARVAYDNLRDATLHSTTYYGFGEETATAIEALNIIVDEDLVGRSAEIGSWIEPELRRLQMKYSKLISDVRGSGSLWGLIFQNQFLESIQKILNVIPLKGIFADPRLLNKLIVGSIVNALYDEHSIITYFGSNIENPLILSFPLISSEVEVFMVIEALDKLFNSNFQALVVKFAQKRMTGPKSLP